MRYMIESAVTDFPQPLSPTSPTTSPSPMSKSTPSTACTVPWAVANSVFSPRMARRFFTCLPPEPRVHDVPEPVADEIDRDGEDEEREAGQDDGPGVAEEP